MIPFWVSFEHACTHDYVFLFWKQHFHYSIRQCCHIRVFHPYLTVPSPPLIILWHGPRVGDALTNHPWPNQQEWHHFSEPFVTLYWTHVSTHFWSILFIIYWWSLWPKLFAGRTQVQRYLCRFDSISSHASKTFSSGGWRIFLDQTTTLTVSTTTKGKLVRTQSNTRDNTLCLFLPLMICCIILFLFNIPHLHVVKRPVDGPPWQPPSTNTFTLLLLL